MPITELFTESSHRPRLSQPAVVYHSDNGLSDDIDTLGTSGSSSRCGTVNSCTICCLVVPAEPHRSIFIHGKIMSIIRA